jgi:hypothetical protein
VGGSAKYPVLLKVLCIVAALNQNFEYTGLFEPDVFTGVLKLTHRTSLWQCITFFAMLLGGSASGKNEQRVSPLLNIFRSFSVFFLFEPERLRQQALVGMVKQGSPSAHSAIHDQWHAVPSMPHMA